jgi:hypothetical protein
MVRGEVRVTTFAHATRRGASKLTLRLASVMGLAARSVPGVLAAGLMCFGVGMIWFPLGVIAAALYLHAIDWKTP